MTRSEELAHELLRAGAGAGVDLAQVRSQMAEARERGDTQALAAWARVYVRARSHVFAWARGAR